MCKILLSINPEHVNNIFNGTKSYEYRKASTKRKVDGIFIYCTSPIKKIVGYADVEEVIEGKPSEVWKKTEKHSGITKQFFDLYYVNRDKAVAYKLKNVKQYRRPKSLSKYGIKNAPQSFIYIN